MTMNMGRKKETLKKRNAKLTMRRRYHYNEKTPFIELFQPKYQRFLIVGRIANELKGLLRNGDTINIRELTFLEFRLTKDGGDKKKYCLKTQIYKWLAKLLHISGKEGTMYGKSTIFRYLTDGHSNFFETELSLKTSVNRELRKIVLTNI